MGCPPSTTPSKSGLGMLHPPKFAMANGETHLVFFVAIGFQKKKTVLPVQTPTALHQPHFQEVGWACFTPLSLQWQMAKHILFFFVAIGFQKKNSSSSADTHCPPSTTL